MPDINRPYLNNGAPFNTDSGRSASGLLPSNVDMPTGAVAQAYHGLRDSFRQTRRPAPEQGYLGTVIDGVFVIEIAREPDRFYVRFPDRVDKVLHKFRVTPIVSDQEIHVDCGIDGDGDYAILGYAKDELAAMYDQHGGELGVFPHEQPADTITYVPSDPSQWTDPLDGVPTNGQEAIDYLAEAMQELTTLTIQTHDTLDLSDPPMPSELDAEYPGVPDGFAVQVNEAGLGDDYALYIKQTPTWIRYQGVIMVEPPVLTTTGRYDFEWEPA